MASQAPADQSLPRRPARVAVLLAVNLVVTLVLLEGVAALYAWLVHGETYGTMAETHAAAESYLPPAASGGPSAEAGQQPQDQASHAAVFNHPRLLHPYFGFTYDRTRSERVVNNHGFATQVDFPYEARPGEYRVGIFGGSVAMALSRAEAGEVLEHRIGELVEAQGFDRVRLLRFAQPGYRQPATLFSLLYFLDSVDLAIFLEGFNEIKALPPGKQLALSRRPFDFPSQVVYDYLATRGQVTESPEERAALTEILRVRADQRMWLAWVSTSWRSHSLLVHEVWRAAHNRAEARVTKETAIIERGITAPYQIEQPGDSEPAARVEKFFSRYEGYVRSAWAAGRAAGVPVFYFIQPNQHVPGSKPLSTRERALVEEGSSVFQRGKKVESYYPGLRGMARRLHEGGVPVYDLTEVFAGNDETLYVDSCCHLNGNGMSLIAEAIVDEIAQDLPTAP